MILKLASAFSAFLLLATPATAEAPDGKAGRGQRLEAGIGSQDANRSGLGGPRDQDGQQTAELKQGSAPEKTGRRGGAGKRSGRLAACSTDTASFCQSIVKGGGAKIRCLKENKAKLSPGCAEALASMPAGTKGKRKGKRAETGAT